MPLRDFQCTECGDKKERVFYSPSASAEMRCETCGGLMKLLERSQEGPGHTTHVRIK